MAKRWADIAEANPSPLAQPDQGASVGALLALAYPDRVAKNRGADGAFLLANGRGANVEATSPLARAPFLAVAEITGTAAQGRVVLAAPLTLNEIEAQFADRIESRDETVFEEASASLRARRLRRLDALTLAEQPLQIVPSDDTARMEPSRRRPRGLASCTASRASSARSSSRSA